MRSSLYRSFDAAQDELQESNAHTSQHQLFFIEIYSKKKSSSIMRSSLYRSFGKAQDELQDSNAHTSQHQLFFY